MAPALTPTPQTENVLTDAYTTLMNSKPGPGKKEQTFDNFENAVASTGDFPPMMKLNNFYDENHSLISSAAAGLSSLDDKTIDNAITGFSESVKVVMKGLDELGQVHPFIAVAVLAFKLVIKLDSTRRENNKKVMAVNIRMQQMMCTFFQLRRVKDADEVGPGGVIFKDRLQPLIQKIARDIRECGSFCDVYMKKKFIYKLLKSPIYEGRLTAFAEKFIAYQDDIGKALTVHTALGVDAANEKLDIQSSGLQSIEAKVDFLITVFRKVDTPRETEVKDFIEKSGGSKDVIERDDLVEKLVKKSGETMANLADKRPGSNKKDDRADIDSVKEKFKGELAEDLDVVLKRNFSLFDRKLEIQERNIMEAFCKQNEFFATAISSGTHDKIKDKDLQNVWREMGWKGSVKARHFVLALRDYFTDQFTTGTPLPRGVDTYTIRASSPDHMSETTDHKLTDPSLPCLADDKWALHYINVTHLQSILEAIDDDGTGFVSIKEANTFAIERPRGWRLLHWIAFWAKGWETSLANYKNKIFLILQEMNELHQKVLKENRFHVDNYLRHYAIAGVELVLRSTKATNEYNLCPELDALTEAHASAEEERLRKNLENIHYDMDSASTVTLITGPGRIERYLFPLLYITLRRHLEVFHYACRNIVDSEEFSHMSLTLEPIFDVVEQRIESLGAIYKQAHVDVNSHLDSFARGMFHDIAIHKNSYQNLYDPRESLILTWQDTSKTKNESDETKIIENAKPIFSFNPDSQNNYQGRWLDWPSHSFDTDPYSGAVLGSWTGHFWSMQGGSTTCQLGLMELRVEVDSEDKSILKGNAVTYSGILEVNGRRRQFVNGGEEYEEFDLVMSFEDGCSLRLVGKLAGEGEELVGRWAGFREKKRAILAYDAHPFRGDPPTEEAVQGDSSQLAKGKGEKESEEKNGEEGSEECGGDGEQTERAPEIQTDDKQTPYSENEGVLEESSGKLDGFGTSNKGDAEPTDEDRVAIAGDGGTEVGSGANGVVGDFTVEADANADGVNGTPDVEGEDGEPKTDGDEPALRTFTFRRTPVEVAGFRRLLCEDQNNAKARWTFLRESVLHLIRRRLWSWSYFKAWNADRTKFLEFHKRNWLLCEFMTSNTLTQAEKEVWYNMKCRLPPSAIQLCVGTLDWSLCRLPSQYGIYCDGCKYCLFEERFICLTCIDPEMSNSFDLCSECKDKPAKRDDFIHTPDHTLIKARHYIHRHFFAWLINEAKKMTTRLKKTFAELQKKGERDGYTAEVYHVSTGGQSELLCGCCARPVRIPCWVCITCSRETFVCLDCEEKERPVLKEGPGCAIHRPDHHLLRLHNLEEANFERQKIDPTVTRINKLESVINHKFESRILALENKMEAQLASFESLLRRIALQLKVPDHEEPTNGDGRFHEVAQEGG